MGEETKGKEKKKKEVEMTKYLEKDGKEVQLFESIDGLFLTHIGNRLMEIPFVESGDFTI
ncbi:MAG: hypothetical protein ACUVTL_10825 [Thermoproteota archaeon]